MATPTFRTTNQLAETSVSYVKNKLSCIQEELMLFNDLWEQVRLFVNPKREALLDKNVVGDPNINRRIYDSTAIQASTKLASGLYSYNISPIQTEWFAFQSPDYAMQVNDEVSLWFNILNNTTMQELMASNFLLEMHLYMQDVVTYGTGCVYVGHDIRDNNLTFKAFPIGSYGFDVDEKGYPSTVYVKFEKTATQMVEKFGVENVSKDVRKAFHKEQREGVCKKFTVWHIVGRRSKENTLSKLRPKTSKDYDFYSIYFEQDSQVIIPMGGYRTQPYIVSRFFNKTGERFGRSPATECMAEIKDANAFRHLIKYATSSYVKPPLFVPEGGVFDLRKLSTEAGAKNTYNPTLGGDKPFYLTQQGNMPIAWQDLNEIRDVIKQAFFWEMFDALGNRKNMTALEVSERIEQQLELFSPTQGRLQVECFKPLLTRVAGIVSEMGKIPPPPNIFLEKPDYEIVYRSKLAMSIRNIQSAGLTKTMGLCEPLMAMNPQLMDNFNTDKIVREVGMNENMPTEWFKPEKLVAQERMERAKQQQEMQKLQLMENAMGKMNMNKTIEPNSPLSMMEGGLGGGQ